MLAAVLHAPNDLRTEQVETPSAGPGELLVRVGANTICGTDLRLMRGEKGGLTPPTILGHEIAGHVAEVGPGVEGYPEGTAVGMPPVIACHRCFECMHDMENMCTNNRWFGYAVAGGLAEYVLVPADAVAAGNVFAVETELPSEQIALAEPLSCVINGQERTPVGRGDHVLILGAGPIGLFHLQLARASGADGIVVSDPHPGRRATAERFGATVAVAPEDVAGAVEEVTHGAGVDAAFVCVGIPALVNQAVERTRPGGRVNVFAGLKDGWAEVDANRIHYKEIVLTGTSNSRRSNYRDALALIQTGKIDTASMITHRFALSDVVEAIETVTGGDTIKVAVSWVTSWSVNLRAR
jgi:L-iditol 2-dehydrogenase